MAFLLQKLAITEKLEYWNVGILGKSKALPILPVFHYSGFASPISS
jgi:hypothetical protein